MLAPRRCVDRRLGGHRRIIDGGGSVKRPAGDAARARPPMPRTPLRLIRCAVRVENRRLRVRTLSGCRYIAAGDGACPNRRRAIQSNPTVSAASPQVDVVGMTFGSHSSGLPLPLTSGELPLSMSR